MQRIKYVKLNKNIIRAEVPNIYGKWIIARITKFKENQFLIEITAPNGDKSFDSQSLQNAKRKVRKILKEEFEVNLGDEVRSKLCI